MESKSSKSQSDENNKQAKRKESRKKKPVDNPLPEKPTKRTRKKLNESEQQYALPKVIPITHDTELISYRSFDRETSKIILQVPLELINCGKSEKETWTRVEECLIDLRVKIQMPDSIVVEAKLQNHAQRLKNNQKLKDQGQSDSQEQQRVFSVWGKACWVSSFEVSSKLNKQSFKTLTTTYSEIQKVKVKSVASDIFLILNFKEKVEIVSDYNGLINQGNTCYMNSYLQMLFHITEFQNLVFQAHKTDESKFPATLQILFYKLAHEQKPVSAEQLVKSFGWSKKEAQIQQDAQEFSCLFFEALEKKLDESFFDTKRSGMRELFWGKLLHILECIDVGLFNNNHFSTCRLDYRKVLTNPWMRDNMYNTEDYGKQAARKSVKIEYLPPILMIQLKRFEFNPYTYKNEKILQKFKYPKEINFSKWFVERNEDLDNTYCLYSVLVHQGVKAESGHYYVYVRVDDAWYKFNDQEVTRASERQVFEYNFGGENDMVDFDSREMKVMNKKITLSSTAYMLVYVRKQAMDRLINSKIVYPDWLKERELSIQNEKEELKARKNYYHNIKAVHWSGQIFERDANFIGLFDKNCDKIEFKDLDKIPKAQRVEQWVKRYNANGLGVYLYQINHDKIEYQSLINLQHKKCTFQEIIKEQISLLYFIFLPVVVGTDSFMCIIKKLTFQEPTEQEDEQAESRVIFDNFLEVRKTMSNWELYDKLDHMYKIEGYTTRFYFEEKKQLKPIDRDNSLVSGPMGTRNILQIIIVEQVPKMKRLKDVLWAKQWYTNLKNTVEVIARSEGGKYEFLLYVDQNLTIEKLRELMFEEKLKDDEMYDSHENIVLKCKLKKTSKIYVEVISAKTVKDLIKGCDREKIIFFEPSKLKALDRVNQAEIKFYYQFDDFTMSDSLHLIIDKKSDDGDNIYTKISSHPEVMGYLSSEGHLGIRLLVISKDRYSINQLVMPNGFIPGKGEITNVLQKEKNVTLVVQGARTLQVSELLCPVLLNHKSQNGEKIGQPRYLEFDRRMTLLKLREEILEVIKDETYEWDDKKYSLNPFKVYIYAFIKDVRKKIDLYEETELSEGQFKQDIFGINSPVPSNQQDLERDKKQVNDEEKQKKGSGSERENEVDDANDENNNEEPVQKGRDKSRKQSIKYCDFTIQSVFPKAKYIKVCVNHLYLVRVNQMKLNV